MAFDPAFSDAIAKIESGGNYGILGPVTKSGDRAYGKYQVMGANIPQWTKEILGAPMTPQQFLSNPQAQDAVFQGKFGQYADKYGPEGAAQAWFGGPGAVGKTDRTDQLGTSVGSYGKQFMANLTPSAQPLGAPQPPPQQPLPPQPLNTAAQTTPQQTQQLPQMVAQQSIPSQPMQMPQAPALNAPQLLPLIRQFNMMRAFSKIPTPAGFQGFSYS